MAIFNSYVSLPEGTCEVHITILSLSLSIAMILKRIIWLGDSKKLLKLIPFTADSLMGIHSFNRNECWI
jgi:hypothetical protein